MGRNTLAALTAGRVVAGVISEIGMIPSDTQDPVLVAQALASARVMDDPESRCGAPAVFARLMVLLDALHEGVDDA